VLLSNTQDNYPHTAAVWFTEVDEPKVISLLDSIDDLEDTTVTSQVKTVLTELCSIFSLELPKELEDLKIPDVSFEEVTEPLESDSESEEEEFMAEDDVELETKALEVSPEETEKLAVDNGDDLSPDKKEILKRFATKKQESSSKVKI
jgi:hypothetical protein